MIKLRIARSGGGKSGGFRTIILFRAKSRTFFVHGFARNEVDNIRANELADFKKLADLVLAYDDKVLDKAIASGVFMELTCDDQAIS